MKKFYLDSDIEEIIERLDTKEKLEGKTILMSGARGFLGRYFIEIFKKMNQNYFKKPVKIIALDNLITSGIIGSKIDEEENVEFMNYDITKPLGINHDIDYVIHAAGIASPHYYRMYPLETLDVAINGTRNMLNIAKEKNQSFFSFHQVKFMAIQI